MSLDSPVENAEKRLSSERALPDETPIAMPRHGVYEQGLSMRHNQRTFFYVFRTLIFRLFVLSVMSGLSYYGITEIYGVLSTTHNVTYLQWLFLILFSINFLWISFAFSQALLGFLLHLKPRLIKQPEKDADFTTAILMPIYNEDPVRIKAAIKVMREDLLAKASGKFAFFILSDTNKADAWIAEEQAFMAMVNQDEAGCPIYYRRRQNNSERKAGNIADWVRRWGGAYEAMIVLDADSIMNAESMLALSRRMAASPGLGLIQSLPTIVRANTLYGRLQQFANHCFGPIYAEGLSAWHGLSSNFWGHNAIIRTRAFAESSHLPILPGKAPFGGHVLSHDFIEAAFLRRAGWGVRFDTDIKSSFEEAPPSLVDVMIRDRRWCQGNLQHTPFMLAQGFVLPTRLHIFSGLMSYLSAVFWLALIVVGLAIALQATYVRPEYFANPSLFPTWPVFDSERALTLFMVSMAIVIAPKVFGWFAVLINIPRCMQFGGPLLLTLSVLLEMILSALYAPILMVHQFGVVVGIFRGKDAGWMPQSRDDGALRWGSVARAHAGHTLFGIILGGIALVLSQELFYWLLPITGGLVLSIPLSWLSGGARRSKLFKWLGLLRAPEEKHPAPVINSLEAQLSHLSSQPKQHAFRRLLNDPQLYNWHIAQLPDNSAPSPVFHSPRILAEWKVRHADTLQQLESWLEPDESMAFLNQRYCLQQLKSLDDKFLKQVV